MEELREKLELWALDLVRAELEKDCRYRLLREEQGALWERFKAENPKVAVTAHIRLTDLDGAMREQEGYLLFWLGLRLGAELGR